MLVKDNSIVEINNNFLDPVLSPPVPIVPSWATIAKVGLNDLIIDDQQYVEINVPYVQTAESTGMIKAYLEIPIPNDRLNDKFVVVEYNFKPFRTANYRTTSSTFDFYYWIEVNRINRKFNTQFSTKFISHTDSSFSIGNYYVPDQTTTTITYEYTGAPSFNITANRICDTGINVRLLYDVNEYKEYILYSTSPLPTEIVKSDMTFFDYSAIMTPLNPSNTSYMLSIISELPWGYNVYDNKTYSLNSGLAFDSPSIDSNIVIKSYNGETLE